MKQRTLGIVQAVLIAVLILSGAIALPILFRPFFYWHIAPLKLPEISALTIEQIKTAYNEMLDFCIGLSDRFSAGVLPYSQSGADHFADVQKLFVLDLWAFGLSAIVLIALKLVFRREHIRLAGHTPGFWGAVGLSATGAAIGILAALDFEKAFTLFHTLFFPGKDNWLFDPRTDPIITLLPGEFFRNCAILILAGILLSCGGLILWDCHRRRSANK